MWNRWGPIAVDGVAHHHYIYKGNLVNLVIVLTLWTRFSSCHFKVKYINWTYVIFFQPILLLYKISTPCYILLISHKVNYVLCILVRRTCAFMFYGSIRLTHFVHLDDIFTYEESHRLHLVICKMFSKCKIFSI